MIVLPLNQSSFLQAVLLVINYIIYSVLVVIGIIYFYFRTKLLNLRRDLKGEYLWPVFINPLVMWGLKNEFPKNKEYTALYKKHAFMRLITLVVGVAAIAWFFVYPVLSAVV